VPELAGNGLRRCASTSGAPPPVAPKTFHEVAWRLVRPSDKAITCAIVLIATGYEVRVGYSDDEILEARRTAVLAVRGQSPMC
jgi:hypothetical protein